MRIPALLFLLFSMVAAGNAQFFPEKIYDKTSFTPPDWVSGDFNNDGKTDVLGFRTQGTPTPELRVLPGNGQGGFGKPIITPVTGIKNFAFEQVAVGDFNRDGNLDVAIPGQDSVTGTNVVAVMLGEGNGKFQAPTNFSGGGPGSIIAGDFNHAERLSLAVLAQNGSGINVLLGHGDGTFSSAIVSDPGFVGCPAVADFNGDANLDLTVGSAVALGNGDGTFQTPLPVSGGGTGCPAVGDFNKDGNGDLVTSDANNLNQIRVFLGNGTGNFTTSTTYRTGLDAGHGRGLAVADFNHDGNPDVAVLNSGNQDVTILLGKGDGSFNVGKTFASAGSVLTGDFNNDNRPDLAVSFGGGLSVLLGNGNGTFRAELARNDELNSLVRLADFNNDHKIDLITYVGAKTSVQLGRGDGTFGPPKPLPSGCQVLNGVSNGNPLAVGDFNHDGEADVAVVGLPNGGVAVCLGNGDGTFKPAQVFDQGIQHHLVLTGDFNNDGKLDLAVSDQGGISILLGNGDGTFGSGIPTALAAFPIFALGDFNDDGKRDIAAISGSNITVLLGKGDGTFQAPINSTNTKGALAIAAGDLNKDGNSDVVTANAADPPNRGPALSVLLGNGDGTFKTATFIKSNANKVLLRDLNGDGNLDIVGPTPFAILDVLLGNGNGTFQPTRTFPSGQNTSGIAAGDINGDGLIDVVTSNSASQNVIVYLNRGKAATGKQALQH